MNRIEFSIRLEKSFQSLISVDVQMTYWDVKTTARTWWRFVKRQPIFSNDYGESRWFRWFCFLWVLFFRSLDGRAMSCCMEKYWCSSASWENSIAGRRPDRSNAPNAGKALDICFMIRRIQRQTACFFCQRNCRATSIAARFARQVLVTRRMDNLLLLRKRLEKNP